MAGMGNLSQRLQFLISANADEAIRVFQKTGATAEKELGRADSKLDKMGASLTKFGAGAMAFSGVAAAGLYKMAQTASDVAESVNAVTVTFGEASAGVLKLSDNAAKSVGMAKADFNELTVSLAGFADKIGGDVVGTVDDLTTRIADFASVMNLDVNEAATTMRSALAGESEAMRRYGIDVSAAAVTQYALANGISDSAATMTEAEKIQARYGLLMQETSQWAGDFANTSDGAANQQRILTAELKNASAEIGAGLLPIMTTVVSAVGDAVGAFGDLPGPVKQTIGTVAGFGTVALGAAGAVSFIAGQVIKFRTNLGPMMGALRDADGGLTRMGRAAKSAGIALGAIAVTDIVFGVLNDIGDASGNLERKLQALNIALGTVEGGAVSGEAAMSAFRDAVAAEGKGLRFQNIWEDAGKEIELVGGSIGRNIEEIDRAFNKLLDSSPQQAQALLDVWAQQNSSLDTSSQQYKDNAMLIERYQDRVDLATGSTEALQGATEQNTGATDEAAGAAKRLSEAVKEQKSAFDIASEAADAFRSALDEALGGGLDYEEASQAVIEGLDAVTAAFQENGATLDINTEAGRANRDAIADQVENIAAMGEALVQQGMSAEDAATYVAGYRQQLIDQAVASGVSQEAAEAYIDQLGLTPESIQTTIKLLKAEQTKAKLLEVLDGIEEIPPEKEAEIKTLIEDGKFGQAKRKLREFVDEDRSPQIKPEVDKDKNKDAKDKLKRLDEYPIEPTAKPEVDPTSKANVETELDELTEDRTVTIRVREVTERADGGITIANADGNFLPQDATIHNGGTLYQWGEPETGGEAFIPLSPAKRKRSLDIWKRVGQYFGIVKVAADGVTAGPSSPGLAPVMPEVGTEAFKRLEEAAKAAGKSVEDYFDMLVDQYDQQAEIYENMYELGKVDTESYIAWLQQKRAALVAYSDEWMSINSKIDSIRKEQAKSAIELAYDEAEATYAVTEARRSMRSSRADFLKALDPKSEASPEEQDAAGRSYAQSIVETLAARAANRGIEPFTIKWARFMRRNIERQINKPKLQAFPAVQKWLKNELSKIPEFDDVESEDSATDTGGTAAPAAPAAPGGAMPSLNGTWLGDTIANGPGWGGRSAPAVVIQSYNAYTDVDNMALVKMMEGSVKFGTLG